MQYSVSSLYLLATLLAIASAAPAVNEDIVARGLDESLADSLRTRGFNEFADKVVKRADQIQHAPEGFTTTVGLATQQLSQEAGRSSAGNIYGVLDSLDHVADYAAAALGQGLSPVTGGVSQDIAQFAGGKLIQSINHGTFALASYALGDAFDNMTGLSSANAVSDRVNTASNSLKANNYDTTEMDTNNAKIRQQLVAANSTAVSFQEPIVLPNGTVISQANVVTSNTGVDPAQVSAAAARLATETPAVDATASGTVSGNAAAATASTAAAASSSGGILSNLLKGIFGGNSISANLSTRDVAPVNISEGIRLADELLENSFQFVTANL